MNLLDIASYANANLNVYCLVLILANLILLPSAILLYKQSGISLKEEIFDKSTLSKDIVLGVVLAGASSVIRINKYDFPYDVVRSRLEKIDFHTMEYVLECLRNNTTKVRNIRSYMLTTLYNAPVTCSNYYKAEVNHDFYGK